MKQDDLKTVLWYDPDIGDFIWLINRRGVGRKGSVAGSVQVNGYIALSLAKRKFFAHRLAWFYMTGKWPKELIDHINGVKTDNRWGNLREATYSENARNSRGHGDNKSGLKGIYQRKNDGRWIASIRCGRQRFHIGSFQTPEEAHAAYAARARELFADFARAA